VLVAHSAGVVGVVIGDDPPPPPMGFDPVPAAPGLDGPGVAPPGSPVQAAQPNATARNCQRTPAALDGMWVIADGPAELSSVAADSEGFLVRRARAGALVVFF